MSLRKTIFAADERAEFETAPSGEMRRVLGRAASQLPAEAKLPLVSVIVTAYNYEQFVQRTLESVAAQSYGNFECIVVDDCSTDGTLGEIEEFLAERRDARFRLLHNQVNRGQLGAQIAGFRECSGTFVVFLDADDLLFRDCLETHVTAHLQCEPIPAMTCLDSATINRDGELLSAHHREIRPRLWEWFRPRASQAAIEISGEPVECRIIPPSVANGIVLRDQYFWTTQSFMMFRGDFLKLVLPANTDQFRVCSDYYLVCMAHAFNTTVLVHRCGGAYRVHGGNQFTHALLVSADQHSGDMRRFEWQPAELAALAAPLIGGQFERFASVFGEICAARALVGLPRKLRPAVLGLLRQRLRLRKAVFFLAVAYASRWVARLRGYWMTFLRIIWSGN